MPRKKKVQAQPVDEMLVEENSVKVRMYRQGHGDCFLLAFPRAGGGRPVYVLIDCGYKPGSPDFLLKTPFQNIVDNIKQVTGKHLDLVIITHEHQDHVNGFWKKNKPYFGDFEIDKAWLAWTEDPNDELANELRRRHKDQLLGLIGARNQLAMAFGEAHAGVARLDSLLSLEFGGEENTLNMAEVLAAAGDPSKSTNKQAIKLIKDKAIQRSGANGIKYLRPGGKPLAVPGAVGARAWVLGPPRNEDLLEDEDPVGSEAFPGEALATRSLSFAAAASSGAGTPAVPFAERYQVPLKSAFDLPFFVEQYGRQEDVAEIGANDEMPTNPPWRRIGEEWLYSAESLALMLNTGINNTSLVLAFELPVSKKVLLFTGDAQRGNWVSWDDIPFLDGEKTFQAHELLARTVLYKVGHHGSHNATLAGKDADTYPNLSWMGTGAYAGEFTALIPAINQWALEKNNPPWRHPLPSIKKALLQKAHGRVLQLDEAGPVKPDPNKVPDAVWKEFLDRVQVTDLYYQYEIIDQ